MRARRVPEAIWGLAVISLVYWICAGMRAAYRPFWFDEIVTWQVSRLPDLKSIWAALREGVDHETPLTHLAVRIAHACFGTGHLATRLPALTGFWIMLLAVYAFLKRRLPLPYALAGMVFPMLTFAWPFAFEARAYGVVLGCEAVALLAWQNAAEGRWRRLSLAGIGVSLAVGLGSHPFAVLNVIPLALGEGVRTLERKRVDPWVWLAMAAGALGLLTFPGSIEAARDWDFKGLQPSVFAASGFYDTMFRNAVAPLLFAGLAVCVFARREKEQPAAGAVLPLHETAALIGYMVAPLVFFLGGLITDRFIYTPKYGLLCVIGAACGAAVALFRATGGGRRSGWVILAVLVAWLSLARGKEAYALAREPGAQFVEENPVLVEALAAGAPVVVADLIPFLAADFYLPAESVKRLNYVIADRQSVRKYVGQDLADQLVLRESRVLTVRAHVEALQSFAARHPRFLLHTSGSLRCLMDVLLREGWRLNLTRQHGGESVYEVNAPVGPLSGAAGAPLR